MVKLLSDGGLGGGGFGLLRSISWLFLLCFLGLLLWLLGRNGRRCRMWCYLLVVSGSMSLLHMVGGRVGVNRRCMVRSLVLWVGNHVVN